MTSAKFTKMAVWQTTFAHSTVPDNLADFCKRYVT
jgi:hypothetical protein